MLTWLKEKLKSNPPEMLENEWYKIVKFDTGFYGVKRQGSVSYIDLDTSVYAWRRGDTLFVCCQGYYSTAKRVFNRKTSSMIFQHAKEIE